MTLPNAVALRAESPSPTDTPLVLHTRVVTGTGGGPDKTIINSAAALDGRGFRVRCAYMRDPRDMDYEVLVERGRAKGVELLAIDDHGPFDLAVASRFAELCRRLQPAIWHGHDYKSNLLGLWLRRQFPMHLVTTVHGWVKHTWKTPLYYGLDRLSLARYDEVICVSEDLHAQCLAWGVLPERCCHVPNAIDTNDFRRTRTTAQAQAARQVPSGRLVIGSVGRLSAEKGFDLLIEAVAMLLAEGHDLQLWIAGEGDAQPQLARLIAERRLEDRVKLLGFEAAPKQLYEALDVFVLSSLREGLPNVVLEAMAMETPVLATRIAGVPRLISDEVNGLLVEPGSSAALAEKLRRLISDPGLRAKLAMAARETVCESFSFSTRMNRIRAIYDRVLAKPLVRNGRAAG